MATSKPQHVMNTKHSDAMGLMNDVVSGSPLVTKYEQGARWSRGILAAKQISYKSLGLDDLPRLQKMNSYTTT